MLSPLPSPPMTALTGSSVVESTAIPTTTNTSYGKTKLKEGVGIEEYEMVDESTKPLSPRAQDQPLPLTTVETKCQDMYEDVSPSVVPHRSKCEDMYEDVSPPAVPQRSKCQDMYEDVSPPAVPQRTKCDDIMYEDVSPSAATQRTDVYEDVSLSGEQ